MGVNVGDDSYDTTAPGDPVESVDVFYDQLSPYGVWVDEPDVGRVFVPDTPGYVPYTNGHWQYTNLGFVWVSSEPHAWATAHYGRWAYSSNYGRWYWTPDTQWGPAWVEWRQTGTDFGWAPLGPEVVVRAGWQAPVESWHYCRAEHVLDANVTRYYEPRARVVEIHREARPIEHYSTVSNVRVIVGPGASTLRERHVAVRPARVESHTIGRWSPAEAHAQVARAREHQPAFEVQNQHRIESHAQLHAAQVKVIESHPQIKAQVNTRVQVGGGHPAEPNHGEPARGEPARGEPHREAPGQRPQPQPAHVEQRPTVEHPAPNQPEHAPAPRQPEHAAPTPPVEHTNEAPHPAPAPARPSDPARQAPSPRAPAGHTGQPAHGEPEHRDERKEPEHR